MTKNKIVYYTDDRVSLSLGNLMLKSGCFVEDLFDALEDAETFDDLTRYLNRILAENFRVDRITANYIRYKIVDRIGNVSFLKFSVKENE